MKKEIATSPLAVSMFVGVGVSQAAVIFSDDFNGENGGLGVLNYTGLTNWVVSGGTIDLIGNGFFDFYPSSGLYIDLDGSTANSGVLSSASFSLNPGVYTLQFALGGSQRGDTNSVTVKLGSLYNETFTLASADPLALITRTATVTSLTMAALSFENAGGDNIGIILDNVSLSARTSVPEPASVALLGLGLIGMGLSRLKRSK